MAKNVKGVGKTIITDRHSTTGGTIRLRYVPTVTDEPREEVNYEEMFWSFCGVVSACIWGVYSLLLVSDIKRNVEEDNQGGAGMTKLVVNGKRTCGVDFLSQCL